MTDQTIEVRPGVSLGVIVFLVLALVFGGLSAFTGNAHPAFLAAPCLAVAAALALTRPRPFAAHFTAGGVEVMDPRLSLGYADIESVRGVGRPRDPSKRGPRRFALQLLHPGGV